ncbi:Arm DNA-binding domain-containing protein [Microvirga aerilata]|uniref:Arm DNA-binding domain-containing protein n=1 Tax=Microvirga aerilata TaxID=670292 RepID=UPI0036395EC2
MTKKLTAAAVEKLKPTDKRQEIPDTGSDGLRLIIQPSGAKSWAMRFRRPDGTHAKLTLGPVDLSGREGTGTPVMGAPLTLREARWLATEVTRKRAAGVDFRKQVGETFIEVAADFIKDHKDRRTWADIARMLGLAEDLSPFPAAWRIGGETSASGRSRPTTFTRSSRSASRQEFPGWVPPRARATTGAGRWGMPSGLSSGGPRGTEGTRSTSTRWPGSGALPRPLSGSGS